PTNRSVRAASRFSPALPESFADSSSELQGLVRNDGTSRRANRRRAEAKLPEVSTNGDFESTSDGCSSLRNLPAIAMFAPFVAELVTRGAGGSACGVFRRHRLLLPQRLPALVPVLLLPSPPPQALGLSDLATLSSACTCAAATRRCTELPELSNRQGPRNGAQE